ncbi:MAG: protease family protein [Clostridiales bacterium]|jgi:membrane protease YdiL (CAAX protease family)|nr:protease family protein [Clostridiales bacterium]MDN5298279.1 protease family protein [Clostridiales bacterium]
MMIEPTEPIRKRSDYTVLEANMLFIILAGVFLTLGAYVQTRSVLSGLLITEYGIILAPVLLYSIFSGKSVKKVFRIRRLPIKAVIKIIGIAVMLLPIIAVSNLFVIWIIENLSEAFELGLPTASSSNEYILLMFIIAVTAGICEESLFRGVVLNAYETAYGTKWGAIFSGLLFGIFHFNPQNLLGPIILGIVFAYMVQITDSIFAGVLAHTMNNGIAVTMGYLVNTFLPESDVVASQEVLFDSTAMLVGVIFFYTILALLTSVGLYYLLKSLKRDFPKFEVDNDVILNDRRYRIVKREADQLYLLETGHEISDLRVSDAAQLKRLGAVVPSPIWRSKGLHMSHLEWLPLLLTLALYGYIIYYAYG